MVSRKWFLLESFMPYSRLEKHGSLEIPVTDTPNLVPIYGKVWRTKNVIIKKF